MYAQSVKNNIIAGVQVVNTIALAVLTVASNPVDVKHVSTNISYSGMTQRVVMFVQVVRKIV